MISKAWRYALKNFWLGTIIFLFLVTRLYKISEVPGSVYWDEASIGYNAFAISTDLKDEWGEFLPLHFRAFGEFKLPVYIYSVAILTKLFGSSEFTLRLPSVLYSLGIIIIVYFLTLKISKDEKIGLLSSFLLSISPWFFIFSRTGYEATAGLFFFFLATYLFLLVDKNKYYIISSAFSFILSFYSYNSFRIIIPVWAITLLIYKFGFVRKYFIVSLISLLLFLLSLIPVYRLYKYDSGGARFAQVEIKSKTDFVKNYISHFSPDFLFLKGDTNPRSQIPGHGQLYLFEFPLLLLGLMVILRSKKFEFFLPLILLLLAPIPAALTRESPHALRSLLAAPSFAIISALGVNFLSENIKRFGKIIILIAVTAYCLSFESYAMDFFNKYSMETASAWQREYKDIFTMQKSGIVTDKYAQPYIFALYYQKYDPQKFRSTVKYNPVDKWGFSLVSSFGDYKFNK